MITLSAKVRIISGRKVKSLRKKEILPAVLYGPKIENTPLSLDFKEFEKVYEEAGESSIIKLEIEQSPDIKEKRNIPKEALVLIKEVVKDPLTEKFLHVDFYQPRLEEEVEVTIPLVFKGEAPAVKELGGVLVKNILEIDVKALPQNLPKEIMVDISGLATFDDAVAIRDLVVPEGVAVQKEPDEVIAAITPPEKEEIIKEKPVEEAVEAGETGEKGEEEREEASSADAPERSRQEAKE